MSVKLGTTSSPNEAGYIMRDGRMLDLSGKRDGGPAGVRYMDHREVAGIIKSRATKATPRDLKYALTNAQADRKRGAKRLHEITNTKSDLVKIKSWDDPLQPEVKESMLKRLNKLLDIRRARRGK